MEIPKGVHVESFVKGASQGLKWALRQANAAGVIDWSAVRTQLLKLEKGNALEVRP